MQKFSIYIGKGLRRGLACLALGVLATGVKAQLLAGKTNVLLWGNLTPNFGLELVTSERTSVNLGAFHSLDCNPMDCGIKGADMQLRYWLSGRAMAQSFVAVGVQGMRYNATFSEKRHRGDAGGMGIVYGYVLPVSRRWNVEFSAGVSMMWFREQRYGVNETAPEVYNATGKKLMPMGLGISCSYIFK